MALSNLTKDLLSAISKGIASTKVLAVPENGQVTFSNLDFTSAGQIFSIEDSFSIEWGEPTITEIKVDQGLASIDTKIEQGEVTFSANYPTIAEAALAEFFKAGNTSISVTADATHSYTGKSIFTDPKSTELTMLIEDQNQEFGIVLARVSVTARLAYDSDSKIWYIGLDGRVLTNLKSNEGDILIAKKPA